jgi:hypothetical protein
MVFGSPATSGAATWDRGYTLATIPDGASNTLFFTERAGQFNDGTANLWCHGGWNAAYMPMFGYGGNYNKFQLQPFPGGALPYGAATPHSSGILAALGDGSVRNVAPSVSQATWQNAILPDDGQVLGSDW